MSDDVTVTVPPEDYRASELETRVYQLGQDMTRHAMRELGVDMGFSMILSGVCRELRRHIGVEATQEVLRQVAECQPRADELDRKAAERDR
jgi:chemotaxis regulatin CheY-phosphate phosphatase CheZ